MVDVDGMHTLYIQARDMVEASKWDLEAEDVATLEEVALGVYKKRRKINEMLAKARH